MPRSEIFLKDSLLTQNRPLRGMEVSRPRWGFFVCLFVFVVFFFFYLRFGGGFFFFFFFFVLLGFLLVGFWETFLLVFRFFRFCFLYFCDDILHATLNV